MEFEIGNNEVYLKDKNGKKVACVSFEICGENEYNISHTYVDESMRGQGVATRILEFVVGYLKSIGVKKIHATCSYAAHWLEKNNI